MKRLLLTSSLAALLLSSAVAVAAPDKDKGPDKHDRDRHGQYDDYDRRGDDRRDDDRRHHDNGRHLGQEKHAWKRGGYAPREYLGDRYYVRDYRSHHLSAPPRGYRWVRPEPQDDRYLLVQATSGLIAQVFGY